MPGLFMGGVRYVREHPQILFTLLLVIIIPLAFLFSANQFLQTSSSNQDTLEKSRIGLMQDIFMSMLISSNFDTVLIQKQIEEIAKLNPDITKFIVAKETKGEIVPVASLNTSNIGIAETNKDIYQLSRARSDETLIFPYVLGDTRYWQAFRSTSLEDGSVYYVLTELSFEKTDALFASRKQIAYVWLFGILLIIGYLLYRQVRLIDYSYMYKEAKKAIETKDLFSNMIAHELRAPLTAIRGYADIIHDNTNLDVTTHEQATRISDSAERLILIVNDLLDVARIQSGKMSVTKEEVEVSKIVLSVIDALAVSGSEKSITLSSLGTNEQHVISGDAKRLAQALTNLVSNAIKYTEKGVIEISLAERHDRVELRVKDTGMGISADDQKKLFAPFFRVESQSVSQITGTGLGMWITKELIELMGGSVGVESIKGVGTHVVVTLPKK